MFYLVYINSFKMSHKITFLTLFVSYCLFITSTSCEKKGGNTIITPVDTTKPVVIPFDINSINDTYSDIASATKTSQWGPYNVHDPSVIKDGEYYYCYNTDVAFGTDIRPGIQIRRSKDLIEWQFYGWVFEGLPAQGAAFIRQRGGTPFNSLWAPYIMKVGNEFRLYYSLSSPDPTPRLSVIGLATAPTPVGPWTEKGLAVTSLNDNSRQTNAIDPTVIIDQQGQHWMYYGSAWDGIYMLKLNPTTGLADNAGDKGRRIANRGFTGGKYNGNIEGPDIIYNPTLRKYFLFIAYDWLSTKYNVRVGRSDSPEGPFLDYNGKDINTDIDHTPMILAPYKFMGHGGWQGVAHCGVFNDGNGQFYMAHQGRPGVNFYYMNLHVRKIYWTSDGWPVVSPERYAATDLSTPLSINELLGDWEYISLGYRVVPGYDKEQVSPDFQNATKLTLAADGTFNGDAQNKWTFAAPNLELKWSTGLIDKVIVERGRDWENKKAAALIFTGLNNQGTAIWGKK